MCLGRNIYTQALFTERVFLFGRQWRKTYSIHNLKRAFRELQRSHSKRQRYLYPQCGDRQTDWLTSNLDLQCEFFPPHLWVLLFKIASGYRRAPQIPKAHCLPPNSHSPSVSHEQLMTSPQCLYFREHFHPGENAGVAKEQSEAISVGENLPCSSSLARWKRCAHVPMQAWACACVHVQVRACACANACVCVHVCECMCACMCEHM